jgi:hypothetical protein
MHFIYFFFLAPLASASVLSHGTYEYSNGTLIVAPESIPRLSLSPSVLSQLNSSETGIINLESFGLPSPAILPVTSQDYLNNPTHSKTHCDFSRRSPYGLIRNYGNSFMRGLQGDWCCILDQHPMFIPYQFDGCPIFVSTDNGKDGAASIHMCGNKGDCVPCWAAGQAILQVARICRDGWNMKGGYVRLSQFGKWMDVVVNRACRKCGL